MSEVVLNSTLLGVCVALVCASTIYLFFWNRIFGWLLGIVLRIILWNQDETAAWVGVGSAHLSLISGRILLRDVRYHSSNQSLRIVKCQISWRWWLRVAAEEEDLADVDPVGERPSDRKQASQCRIHTIVEGFEWFLYNRTASVDAVLSQLFDGHKSSSSQFEDRDSASISSGPSRRFVHGTLPVIKLPPFIDKLYSWLKKQLPDLDPKHLLPLSFEASKGAITLGNHTTENILLARFASCSGTYGIVQARSELDIHRQHLRIVCVKPDVSLLQNPDYWTDNTDIGKHVLDIMKVEGYEFLPVNFAYENFRKVWNRCRRSFSFFRRGRYARGRREQERINRERSERSEAPHTGADFNTLEYAIHRNLLTAPALDLRYVADVAGLVPKRPFPMRHRRKTAPGGADQDANIEYLDIGNVDIPPEWGLEVVIHGGSIHYGPWADRQRAQLQRVFFPAAFQTIEPFVRLSAGDHRACTCFNMFFEFRGTTTITIPFKEASKNWQWDGEVDVPRTSKQREAASFQIRLGDRSSVRYLVPMIATLEGYTAHLRLELDDMSVASTLNDIVLLKSNSCTVSSSLPSPLRWNEARIWELLIKATKPTIFLIRDHLNMLIDLGKDWSTGPPNDFNTFVPITYKIIFALSDYELNLYANDHNIIDRPLDRRDNVIFSFKAALLEGHSSVPSDSFRPLSTSIPFFFQTSDIALGLTLPRWNTHALTVPSIEQLTDIGHVAHFCLRGFFTYFTEVRPDCVDMLGLNIDIKSPSIKLFGWLVRHVMVLRDNYFGTFTQYSTTREYLSKREKEGRVGDPLDLKYRPGKSNAFHLDLSLFVENGVFALPASVLGFEKSRSQTSSGDVDMGSCAVLSTSCLQVQLRLHEYFMELALNTDAIDVSFADSCADKVLFSHGFSVSERQLRLSSLDITANRLFGPQPHTTAYVCIWIISVGNIDGTFRTREARLLSAVSRSFAHGFSDSFNAPASDFAFESQQDATFLTVSVGSVDVKWIFAPCAVRMTIQNGLQVSNNNLSGLRHKKVTMVNVPDVDVSFLSELSTKGHYVEAGRFSTNIISANFYSSPDGWISDALAQARFLEDQDKLTKRFATFLHPQNKHGNAKWLNGFYLQNVCPPLVAQTFSRRGQTADGTDYLRDVHVMGPSESESDNERYVSEALRDERLANSRPDIDIPIISVNSRDSSSMDESDEIDSSDFDSSESEHFQVGREPSRKESRPWVHFCRKFALSGTPSCPGLQRATLLANSALKAHGRIFGRTRKTQISSDDAKSHQSSQHSVAEQDDAIERDYCSLNINDILIFLTPRCISFASEGLQELSLETQSEELKIEDLLLEWVPTSYAESVKALQLQVQSICLSILTDIPPNELESHAPSPPKYRNHTFLLADIALHDTCCVLQKRSTNDPINRSRSSLSGSFLIQHTTMSLSDLTIPCRLHRMLRIVETNTLSAYMDTISVDVSRTKAQLTYAGAGLRMNATAIASCFVLAQTLTAPFQELLETKQSCDISLSSFANGRLLYAILRRRVDALSKDLLSMVQPSFFVQKGMPHRLRGDNNWKLLFHLRHALSTMSNEERRILSNEMNSTRQLSEIYADLEQQHLPWAIEDNIKLTSLRLVDVLFHTPEKDQQEHSADNGPPVRSLYFRAGTTCLTVGEDEDGNPSTFLTRGAEIRIDFIAQQLVFEPHSISQLASTNRCNPSDEQLAECEHLNSIVAFTVDSVQVTVFPSVIGFLQSSVYAWKSSPMPFSQAQSPSLPLQNKGGITPSFFLDKKILSVDVRFALQHLLVETAAENIVIELAARHLSVNHLCHISKPAEHSELLDVSISNTIGLEDVSIKARTRSIGESPSQEMDTLAVAAFSRIICYVTFGNHTPDGSALRGTLHLALAEARVPRSALRLYKFVEQWKQDYWHGIQAMLKALVTEIKRPTTKPSKEDVPKPSLDIVELNLSASKLAIILQIMHGTWLTWNLDEILSFIKMKPSAGHSLHVGGLNIKSQSIRIISEFSSTVEEQTPRRSPKIVLQLPSVNISGSTNSQSADLLMSVGFLHVIIKPSHWDSLLSVQQKFGQDFNDILALFGDSMQVRNRRISTEARKSALQGQKRAFFITAKFKGFNVGLEGPSSTQFLECEDIDATVTNRRSPNWQIALTDLALYLLPTRQTSAESFVADRSQMPLMVTVDIHVAKHEVDPKSFKNPRLEFSVTKAHAILQAHLMGDVGDFVDHLQAEVMLRKEERAAELSAFREKARRVMSTFDLIPKRDSTLEKEGILARHIVDVSMSNFAIAFPLDVRSRKERSAMEAITTKALLLSIKSFKFETHKGESGQAEMKAFRLQFLSSFNPAEPLDFSPNEHRTLNEMVYPEMTARLQMRSSSTTRHVHASADISGFVLDLDPSITAYAFSLADAYGLGRQRVERMAASIPRYESKAHSPLRGPSPELGHVVVSTIEASLEFGSGLVRMHPMEPSSKWSRRPSYLDTDPEIFELPKLSVSAEYHADPSRAGKAPAIDFHSPILIFESTVHSSHNTLRPSLLSFITGIVHNVDQRLKIGPSEVSGTLQPTGTPTEARESTSALRLQSANPTDFQLYISLRIDKSRLDLTCKPDVNVVAGVNWESGGFILNVSPGVKGVSVSASIEGLDISLKHGFLSENSAHIDARNLNFSVNFTKASANPSMTRGTINFVSIVVDTEFSGGMRFSRLQDFLCFKAVWLDHIPVFSGEPDSTISPSKLSISLRQENNSKEGFDTAIIVRVRQIALEVDMGQSICNVNLDLQTASVRMRLTSDYVELAVAIARVDMQARGNLSGHLIMPDFMFRTVRRTRSRHTSRPFNRMLELSLTSGTLDVQLQSDWLWLLQYRAEPLEATVFDDWTIVNSSDNGGDRQLRLSFSVTGTKVIAMMTIMAIPKLVMYAGKFKANMEAQREGASKESSAFRSKRLPKPDNALSEVAEAMFQTARTKLKETETISFAIGQIMRLRLEELVFVVLPRSQGDTELARFVGRNVMAQLHRTVQRDGQPAHRDLRLSLSHISISQLIKQGFDPRLQSHEFDILTAGPNFSGTENVIFSLPAMDMRMQSDESLRDGQKMLPYDFVSKFVRRDGLKGENIFISLNISLYSWLTVLRKTLTRELKRAQDISDWRLNSITPPSMLLPRLASPEIPGSPFAYSLDVTTSPSGSISSVDPSSRPSSPQRSKSSEATVVLSPGKLQQRMLSQNGLSASIQSLAKLKDPRMSTSHDRQNSMSERVTDAQSEASETIGPSKRGEEEIVYAVRSRNIERLTVRQLGEATPDVMHPFFTRKAGFNLEESLPQYVHEYATLPVEEIMKALVKLYSKQLS